MSSPNLADLLPHSAPMVLLDDVLEWDNHTIKCSTRSHVDPDNPLRDRGRLSVYCGVEYAAQAMAAHNRLTATDAGSPQQGFIATASKLEAAAPTLDAEPGRLIITATQLAASGESSLYEFTVARDERILLRGQLMVVKQA